MKYAAALVALALLAGPAISHAQDAPPLRPIVAGTAGSLTGGIAGGLVGAGFIDCNQVDPDDFCGWHTVFIGATVGTVAGAATGAWLAARREGKPSPVAAVVGSLVGVGAGVGLAWLAGHAFQSGPVTVVGFSIGHGVITGLVTARSVTTQQQEFER